MDVFRDVSKIIAQHCAADPASLTRDSRLDDLNIESLDLVEIIFEIEERFGIEVPQNASAGSDSRLEFVTVGEIVDGVTDILGQPRTA